MIKLVLLRHGESTWNKENRFTGWTNVPLTEKGREEAREAAKTLKKEGYAFDAVFTSVLKRALDTTDIVLDEMSLKKIDVHKSWRLNERHYGALQGLNKAEMATKYGEEQVLKWRRSYDIRPPALKKEDEVYSSNDPLYKDLDKKYIPLTESLKDTVKRVVPYWKDEIVPALKAGKKVLISASGNSLRALDKKYIPLTESLKDTVKRVVPYWKDEIVPALKAGKKVLISASGNSLRALVKHIDNVPDEEIVQFNIPYGTPLVYELNDGLKPIKHYFLGDPEEIEKKIKAVAEHGKAKK